MKRGSLYTAIGVCCVFSAGCYDKSTENGNLVIGFKWWVPTLVVLAGLIALVVGVVFIVRKQHVGRGIALAVIGPLIAGAVAPGMYMDRVEVNQDGFTSTHGFWWKQTTHRIRYDELSHVQLVFEEKTGRGGRKNYTYSFDCTFKSGKHERVPLGDIVREALPEIAEQFRKNGVTVSVPPNLPG